MKKIIFMLVFAFVFSATQAIHSFAFSDVKKGTYYEDAVKWAQKEKVVSGFPDGTFKPNQEVTFNQFIKMYTNSYDFKNNKAKTYDEFYEVLKQYQLDFYDFQKNGYITRGDVSVLLAYADGEIIEHMPQIDLPDHYEKGAKYMLSTKLSTGQNAGKDLMQVFGSNNTLTRGQAVTFLYRATQMKLTSLKNEVHYLAEPPTFNLHENVLRSYDMGDGIVYHVMNHENPDENYEVVLTIDGKVLGGYIAIVGDDRFGYTLGKPSNEEHEHLYFNLNPHRDQHRASEVRAISYQYRNDKYRDQIINALMLDETENLENVARLYADLANEFRAKNGQPLLEMHPVLTKAAKNHSVDMAKRDFFSHYTPEGLSPGDRINNVATISNLWGWGENISAGRQSVFESHTAWINSLGHRENMLEPGHTHLGFGVGYSQTSKYKSYFTTKFGMIHEE